MSRQPLLHFALLGALLFAGRQLGLQPREVVEAPTLAQAQEEMLVREALRLGLERSDPVVRTRLVMNMRFVAGAGAGEQDLFEQALALGMPQRDVVARRRLVEAMHERFAADVAIAEADIRAYVDTHALRYGARPRVDFEQQQVEGAAVLLARRFSGVSEPDIARSFGADFARAVITAPVGRWTAIRSPYGLHEVKVTAALPPQPPEYAAVRRQARYALLAEREQQAAAQAMRALQRRYELRVNGLDVASAP